MYFQQFTCGSRRKPHVVLPAPYLAQQRVTTVTVRDVGCTARRFIIDETHKDSIPPSWRAHLEQHRNAAAESFKVEHVVDAGCLLDVHEERHAEDGVDEHDKKQEKADVEEGWQGDCEREQQRSDTLGRLHQPQHPSHAEHSHDTQQCWRENHVKIFIFNTRCCAQNQSISQSIN